MKSHGGAPALTVCPRMEAAAYCERVFAPDLSGNSLVSNKSIWRQFPLLATRRWYVGNVLLIGDAPAHRAFFHRLGHAARF